MNIFLLSPNIKESCEELARLDPVRARKQLVECCQLLATVDHIKNGFTNMLKADGTPYKMASPPAQPLRADHIRPPNPRYRQAHERRCGSVNRNTNVLNKDELE